MCCRQRQQQFAGNRGPFCGGIPGRGEYRSDPGVFGGFPPQIPIPRSYRRCGGRTCSLQPEHLCFRKSNHGGFRADRGWKRWRSLLWVSVYVLAVRSAVRSTGCWLSVLGYFIFEMCDLFH